MGKISEKVKKASVRLFEARISEKGRDGSGPAGNGALPEVQCCSINSTVEGCVLANCLEKTALMRAEYAFAALPGEIKRMLSFAPEKGEFKARADLWGAVLKPVLPGRKYDSAMQAINRWYIHILDMELVKGWEDNGKHR